MKIALVVDDLIQNGGQERLFCAISEIWPEAPIYTSVASDTWKKHFYKKGVEIITSGIQKLPYVIQLSRYYSPFLVQVIAFESFDFKGFDAVLSISSRFAHFVKTRPETLHICYMNSPGRMFWESPDYFESENYGLLRPVKFLAKPFLSLPLQLLRVADYVSAQKIDHVVANSRYSQNKVSKYYKRNSEVIYPFVDVTGTKIAVQTKSPKPFFLVVTRLAAWKKVDIAVEACTELGLNLKVVGGGPDLNRLKKMAGSTIEFLGPAPDTEKHSLLANCSVLIQTQREDFGVVPPEAMAYGKPVIAFNYGGTKETVIDGVTGTFFDEQSSACLKKVLAEFDASLYDPEKCIARAKQFSRKEFKENIQSYVQKALEKSRRYT